MRLIWLIDPQRRKAFVYELGSDQPLHLNESGVLDGKEVIPGFQIEVKKLFE